MTNPAELLHAQLTSWREKPTNYADATDQRIAVRHLDAIEELLNCMDDLGLRTDLFRPHFPKWVALTLHHPHQWQKKDGQARYRDDEALTSLDHLADRLNGIVPQLQDGGLEAVQNYIDGVQDLLDEDDSITDPLLRNHISQVIAHVAWCIKHYPKVGDFDLQRAIEHLLATMARATAASTRKDRWRDKLNTFVWPFTLGFSSSIAATPAQLAIAAALGGS